MKNKLLPADKIIKLQKTKPSNYWSSESQQKSLELFKNASKHVPAYADFLSKNNIDPEKIKTWEDFQNIPSTNKNNYLRKYKLDKLNWEGKLSTPLVYTATSGSTGKPVYFDRNQQLDEQYSVIIESFLKQSGDPSKNTLVIVCFGMGLWIGGLITYKAFEIAANRCNFPVSIITPGVNKKAIYNAVEELAPYYEQIIFAGYPPFIKDVLDGLEEQNIKISKYKVRMLFAAEAVSEELRDYLAEKANIKNKFTDFMNIYGSADIGAMAHETLLSILVKRLALKDKKLFNEIFTEISKVPTLAQFNPMFINFESVNGELLLTGNSAIPLIRYAIGDNGGVFTFSEIEKKLSKHGIDLEKEITKAGLNNKFYKLPFVYVYERKDLSTNFYGLCVYPEWIRSAFLAPEIRDHVTGKFTLLTKYDKNKNQVLEVNVELRKNKTATQTLKVNMLKRLISGLLASSSEYKEIYGNLKKRATPKVVYWPAEDPTYFAPGIKQKWAINM